MLKDNKGGLQIRGESGFGKEGKEGGLTMKRERITGKWQRQKRARMRFSAELLFSLLRKAKAILWWRVLSCFVRLLWCAPQRANLPRVTSKRLLMQLRKSFSQYLISSWKLHLGSTVRIQGGLMVRHFCFNLASVSTMASAQQPWVSGIVTILLLFSVRKNKFA